MCCYAEAGSAREEFVDIKPWFRVAAHGGPPLPPGTTLLSSNEKKTEKHSRSDTHITYKPGRPNLTHSILADPTRTPSNKTAKSGKGFLQPPPDRNNRPHQSPALRKTSGTIFGPYTGPNALDTTSAEPFTPGTDSSDEDSDLNHLDLASPSKRPTRGAPRRPLHCCSSSPTLTPHPQ
ncbi:hypothetical protein B0H13DRAFT_2373804 [Mycena leptocephala]|nr:hypothetical protein B0H13DRAFT_2373804 [Mycena leptocephala]